MQLGGSGVTGRGGTWSYWGVVGDVESVEAAGDWIHLGGFGGVDGSQADPVLQLRADTSFCSLPLPSRDSHCCLEVWKLLYPRHGQGTWTQVKKCWQWPPSREQSSRGSVLGEIKSWEQPGLGLGPKADGRRKVLQPSSSGRLEKQHGAWTRGFGCCRELLR